jgi:hypothetical protein
MMKLWLLVTKLEAIKANKNREITQRKIVSCKYFETYIFGLYCTSNII